MVVNKIITDHFKDDSGVPTELLDIIGRFLEIEDSDTYKEMSIAKLFEQRLEKNYVGKTDFVKWCEDYAKH